VPVKEKNKEAWSAITEAGINMDGFKLVQTRKKNTSTAPGIGRKVSPPLPPPHTPDNAEFSSGLLRKAEESAPATARLQKLET